MIKNLTFVFLLDHKWLYKEHKISMIDIKIAKKENLDKTCQQSETNFKGVFMIVD